MNKMINHDLTAVTVIGLGNMGEALAEAFLKGGHPTTVWNRSANKADGLVAKGAALAATVADAVAASPVVIICLSTYEVMHEQLSPLTDELSGRVLVNLTSGTPDQARNTAICTRQQGAGYPGRVVEPPTRYCFAASRAEGYGNDAFERVFEACGNPIEPIIEIHEEEDSVSCRILFSMDGSIP